MKGKQSNSSWADKGRRDDDEPDEAAGSQEIPVGSKERTSTKHVLCLSLGVAMSFLITTFLLGYWVGKSRSPNWESPRLVYTFMKTHHSARFLGAAGRQPLPSDPIELRLRAGDREFSYRTDTNKVTEEPVRVRDIQALPNQTGQSKDDQNNLIHTAEALSASGPPCSSARARARGMVSRRALAGLR
jgi:hypothetical protein